MAVVIDVVNCGSGSVGTYFDGCDVGLKELRKPILLHPSVKIDIVSGTVDNTVVAGLIKKGKLVPLNRPNSIVEAGAKNNVQTYANKSKRTISQGLYEFNMDFEANDCFVRALHKLKLKDWRLCFVDAEGKFHFDNKNKKIQGVEVNYFIVENITLNDGGSKTSNVMASMQLTADGTLGFNTRRSFITADVFDFNEVNGIQDVILKTKSLSIANLIVSVVSGCDKSTPVQGLSTPNFRVLNAVTKTPETIAVIEQGGGDYLITGSTVGPKTIQLYDTTGNSDVADILLTEFFKSNVDAVVLTT